MDTWNESVPAFQPYCPILKAIRNERKKAANLREDHDPKIKFQKAVRPNRRASRLISLCAVFTCAIAACFVAMIVADPTMTFTITNALVISTALLAAAIQVRLVIWTRKRERDRLDIAEQQPQPNPE